MGRNPVKIAPSILSADFSRLCDEITAVQKAGADLIHLDIMDGQFVPNITIGPSVVADIRKCTDLPLDVHLMIANPDQFLDPFIDSGADMVSVHHEASIHLQRTLSGIRKRGVKAGLAINPATGFDGLRYFLEDLDFVLVMSVNPGFGGQAFLPSSLEKIKDISSVLREADADVVIEVDGGVGPDNAGSIAAAGAGILVAGSAIFHKPPYKEAIDRMRAAAAGGIK